MSGPDTTPENLTSEERLRRLLTEAVEPVQPGPGAQARLQAKIRERRRPRDLPRRLRWAGATLGAAAVVAGAVVVIGILPGHSTDSSDGSSASSTSTTEGSAAGPLAAAPSRAAASQKAPAASQGVTGGVESAPSASPQLQNGYSAAKGAETSAGSGSADLALTPQILDPLGRAITPSDLDGDHSADQLTISGQTLVVKFLHSTQTVTLPQVGSGARVLGVTQLQNKAGAWMPVAFVRLQADSAHARDTLVAVVGGKLTVLRLNGKPVVLTVTGTQGYTCAGSLVVTASRVASYVVSGAALVSDGSTGNVAKAGANCGFG